MENIREQIEGLLRKLQKQISLPASWEDMAAAYNLNKAEEAESGGDNILAQLHINMCRELISMKEAAK